MRRFVAHAPVRGFRLHGLPFSWAAPPTRLPARARAPLLGHLLRRVQRPQAPQFPRRAFPVARLRGHRRQRTANGTALQRHLLQTAVLQVQASALPVATHALGLVPAPLAASCTALPLCHTAAQAATYCALFLSTNALAACSVVAVRVRSRDG